MEPKYTALPKSNRPIKINSANLNFIDPNNIVNAQYPVLGMTCASCSAHVQKALNSTTGVTAATVNLANTTAYIEYISDKTSPEALKEAVANAGYELIIEEKKKDQLTADENKRLNEQKKSCFAALLFSIPLVAIAMLFHSMPYANYIMWVLATPIVFFFGFPFFKNAWKMFKNKTSNMDTLVALSSGIAYLFSVINTIFPEIWTSRGMEAHVYYEVAGVVITFVQLGKYLEKKRPKEHLILYEN